MAKVLSGKRKIEAVIFDLDQTLIDSSSAAEFRDRRDWDTAKRMVPQLPVYAGISNIFAMLHTLKIPVGIATSSPAPYCNTVITHHRWTIKATSCYHCTEKRKPHPDPILNVAMRMGVNPINAVSIGDDPRDIVASIAAGSLAVAARWGCAPGVDPASEDPHHICDTVPDLDRLLRSLLS